MLNKDITRAIKERRKLKFIYQGKPRLVDPHIFGISTKGNEVILSWQTGGSSSKQNDIPNWRLFETSEIIGLQVTHDTFVPQAKRHNPYESDIRTLYAIV